jgi:hypothetical protein
MRRVSQIKGWKADMIIGDVGFMNLISKLKDLEMQRTLR